MQFLVNITTIIHHQAWPSCLALSYLIFNFTAITTPPTSCGSQRDKMMMKKKKKKKKKKPGIGL
jgi:hypothetical protein